MFEAVQVLLYLPLSAVWNCSDSLLTRERLVLVIGYSTPHITPSSSVGGKGDVPDG